MGFPVESEDVEKQVAMTFLLGVLQFYEVGAAHFLGLDAFTHSTRQILLVDTGIGHEWGR